MAFGTKDARGIYQFGEDDAEATFSQLLNKGMQSVSDATKYFSGTPAQRALLTPAPDGGVWVDTDAAGLIWRGIGGEWVRADQGDKRQKAFEQNNGFLVPVTWTDVPTLTTTLTGLRGSAIMLRVSGGFVNVNSGATRTAGVRFLGGPTLATATTVIGRQDNWLFIPFISGGYAEASVNHVEKTAALTGTYVVKVQAIASLASAVSTRLSFEVEEVMQ